MRYESVERKACESRGSFHSMLWERNLKTKKSAGDAIVTKRTYGYALRFGVAYDNLASTKQGRADGTLPAQNAGLIGREWIIPNLTLRSLKTGKTLVRVSLAKSSKFVTEYYLNGRKVDKAKIEPLVLKSEIASHEMPEVFDLATDNILAII